MSKQNAQTRIKPVQTTSILVTMCTAGEELWCSRHELLTTTSRPLLTDTFTPINRYTVVSTVSVPQEAGTAVAEGPKRKRARTAPANMLVADYLGIDADPIDFKAKVKVRSKHPLAAVLRPNKRKRATLDLAKSATRVSRAGEVASGVRITDGMPVVKVCQCPMLITTFIL